MRPLKLIVTGFGTYCKRTEIDLEKLGTSGLFLITGDTGSGKTTIFDAITYALFGDLNGQNRSAGMIRSTFATPDIPTEVDLTFEFKGKKYNVKRNPEYERTSKRGEGLTTQIAEATLTMPDGSVITQQSKVTAAIVELLRINKEQFSQIVMIAQGDFQKLLMEGTERRMEIFRNLFKTDYYLKLQNKLLDEEKSLGNECRNIRNQMSVYLSSVQCDCENTLKLQLEKAQKNELPVNDALDVITSIIKDDKETKTCVESKLADVETDLLKNAELLGIAKNLEKAAEDLELKKIKLEEEQKRNIELNELLENQKKKIPERETKEKEAAVLNNELTDYDELSKIEKTVEDLETAIQNNETALKKAEAKVLSLQEEKDSLTEEVKTLKDGGTKLVSLQTEIEKLNEKKTSLETVKKELGLFITAKKDYEAAVEKYKTASENAEKLDCQYKTMRKAFMDEQAGILAEELKDEVPCPVCGSIHHPSPAKKSEKAPTESELNNAEQTATEAQKTAEEKNRNCVEKKVDVEAKKEKISSLWENIKGKKVSEIDDVFSGAVLQEKDAVEKEIESKQELLAIEEKKVSRKEEIENRLPELEAELKNSEDEKTKITVEMSGQNSSKKAAEENLAKLKKSLKYSGKKEAEQSLENLEDEILTMKTAFENAQNNFTQSKSSIDALVGEVKQLEKQIKEGQKIDAKAVQEKDAVLKSQKEELTEKLQTVNSRLDRNKDALNNLEKSSGNLSEKEARYAWVSSVSKTANGNLANGKEKIKLETFIQMNYFDRIIAHANKRLMIMSDGQYELIRKKEAENLRSQTGLELDVIDHYNGGQRSVKSLSGGESFEASLALALGLSDEVRMSAGGIQLDSMFIDEGFGTLDSETLQKAFKALSSITDGNRIVGIISHVDLLKEKIDKQIVVKKERTGGSSVQINV